MDEPCPPVGATPGPIFCKWCGKPIVLEETRFGSRWFHRGAGKRCDRGDDRYMAEPMNTEASS